jgi:hypothetical protein
MSIVVNESEIKVVPFVDKTVISVDEQKTNITVSAGVSLSQLENHTHDGYFAVNNNLSEITIPSMALSNLGLGTIDAVISSLGLGGSVRLDPVDILLSANNLSDLTIPALARQNLGLGTMATEETGDYAFYDHGHSEYLAVANDLGDVVNVDTARTNLGLGSMALEDAGGYAAVVHSHTAYLEKTNNLSDLDNVVTARTNLGLGSMALEDAGGYANVTHSHAAYLEKIDNLSDLDNVVTARTNLGLGSMALEDASGYANVTHSHAAYLEKASNLSDLDNVETARTNLGLGGLSVLDDAPQDGSDYARNNGVWVAVVGSGGDMLRSNNLSDLNNVVTARTNLGLGSMAVEDAGDYAAIIHSHTAYLEKTNNLSDLNNAATARTNLGLGSMAVEDAGDYAAIIHSHTAYLEKTSNLSDLNNVVTARTNLGLGSMAVEDAGSYAAVLHSHTAYLEKTSNLSDLNNVVTARTNLGLGSMAVEDAGSYAAVLHSHTTYLEKTNNLSDLNNAATARTNLGLGSMAVEDTTAFAAASHSHSSYLEKAGGTMTGALTVSAGGISVDGGVVFNDEGIDTNFRVESNNNPNMLFVDGGNDSIGIGTGFPSAALHVVGASDESDLLRLFASTNNCDLLMSDSTTVYARVMRKAGDILSIWNNGVPKLGFTGTLSYFSDNLSVGTSISRGFRINANGTVGPHSPSVYDLGDSNYRWRTIYLVNSPNVSSDRRHKNNIAASDLGLSFINALTPVRYTRKPETVEIFESSVDNEGNAVETSHQEVIEDESIRYGMIAQDVETVINRFGVSGFAGLVYDVENDEYGLRYEEFISPLIAAVQELSSKVSALEAHPNHKDKQKDS